MDATTRAQCEELERMIISNGLDMAKWGELNQAKAPGLNRAMDLLKIKLRRRSVEPARVPGMPRMGSLLDAITAIKARDAVIPSAKQEPSKVSPESLVPMPVGSESSPVVAIPKVA